ncbi:MAG: 5-(carboxyamino)imidazole ribonucleotide mutase [Acidobacteriota bacterium]
MKKVAVLMGSGSDWEHMAESVAALDELGIESIVEVLSAHRSPELVTHFVKDAEQKGVGAFICGAGLAAHLAGAVAAQTTRPVLGVPLPAGSLQGLDALLATVQMPPGVPVATFALGKVGARNAGIFAAQMLALSDPELSVRLREKKEAMEAKVRKDSQSLKDKIGRA